MQFLSFQTVFVCAIFADSLQTANANRTNGIDIIPVPGHICASQFILQLFHTRLFFFHSCLIKFINIVRCGKYSTVHLVPSVSVYFFSSHFFFTKIYNLTSGSVRVCESV